MFFKRRGRLAMGMLILILSSSGVFVVAQLVHLDPSFGSTCDLADVDDRVGWLNAACRESCTAECAAALIPLRDDCLDVLNRLYDAADGAVDGEASGLTAMYDRCLAVPMTDLIDMLKKMQAEGAQCPQAFLDGVAETNVTAEPCADALEGGRCTSLISSGT